MAVCLYVCVRVWLCACISVCVYVCVRICLCVHSLNQIRASTHPYVYVQSSLGCAHMAISPHDGRWGLHTSVSTTSPSRVYNTLPPLPWTDFACAIYARLSLSLNRKHLPASPLGAVPALLIGREQNTALPLAIMYMFRILIGSSETLSTSHIFEGISNTFLCVDVVWWCRQILNNITLTLTVI